MRADDFDVAVETEPDRGPTPLSLSPFSEEKPRLISTPAHGWIITGNPGSTQLKRKNS